jgi:hypothetical protein
VGGKLIRGDLLFSDMVNFAAGDSVANADESIQKAFSGLPEIRCVSATTIQDAG